MLPIARNTILLLFICQTLFGQIHKIFSDKPKLYSIFGNSVSIENNYLITTSKEPFYSPYHLSYLRAFLFKYENNSWIQKDTLQGAIYNQSFNDLGLSYMSFSGKTAFFRKLDLGAQISRMKLMIYDISNDKFELIDSITSEKNLRGRIVLIASSKKWLFLRTHEISSNIMIDYFYKRDDNTWTLSDSFEYNNYRNYTGLFRTQMDENFIATAHIQKSGSKYKPHLLIYKFTDGNWKVYSDTRGAGGSSIAYTDDMKYIAVAWNDSINVYKYQDGSFYKHQVLHADSYLHTTIFAPSIVISNGYLYAGYYDYVYHGNHGEVYQYVLENDQWKLKRKIKPVFPDTTFMHYGESLSISNDRLAIGADYDYTYGSNRGAVYIYDTPSRTNIIDTICQGEDYYFKDTIIQTSGIFTDTLLSYIGLDSIVTLDLTVIPQSQIYIDTVICDGDSIILGDSVISESGYYEFYYNQIHNCESFIKANVELESIEVQDSIFPDFGCNSGQITLNINGNSPPYSFSWENSEKHKDLYYLESGTYRLTISSHSNCDYEYEFKVPLKDPRYIIPNAFFPEGNEEINKTFRIYLSDTTNVKILST
ncbi:MAG TPA: hypothetical protein ENK91_14710, partial [Bacteroidetes bacterium]|nr:hypothetical protein [Bacteroidota bacterium]